MKNNRIRLLSQINKQSIYIYALFGAIMLVMFLNKMNLHVDELLSYTLSNNVGSTNLTIEEGYTYDSADEAYLGSLAVDNESERFNFKNVWVNQTRDVHPPLYYLILHILSSFSLGKFSIWCGAAINICFALLTLYIFRKLMLKLINDRRLMEFASIVFILSQGILHNVSFLRMYVMAMFWVISISYLFVKAWEEKNDWRLWAKIMMVAILGALTHYYCIIYLVATCIVYGICLLLERRWKEIACLSVSMAASAAVSVSVFPAMLAHMFSGSRGTQSVDNLVNVTWHHRWERMKDFYGFINSEMLGKMGGYCSIPASISGIRHYI